MNSVLTYLTSRGAIVIYLVAIILLGGVVTGTVAIDESGSSYSVTLDLSELPFNGNPEAGEYQFFGSNIDRAEWNGNTLNIHLNDEHGSDGLIMEYHAREPDPFSSPVYKDVPRYGGAVEVDLLDILGTNSPPGKYTITLISIDGSLIEGNPMEYSINETQSITIQPNLDVVSANVSKVGYINMEIRNTGNAPVYIEAVENKQQGADFKLERTVAVQGNATIKVFPYRQGQSCHVVPETFELEFMTAPDLEKSITIDTGSVSGECVERPSESPETPDRPENVTRVIPA